MSGFASNVGTLIDKATGSKGKNYLETLVKDNALQERATDLRGDYDTTKQSSQLALDQYIKDYLAGTATASTRSDQEQGAVDRYYNGDVDRALASLRTQHAAASNDALQRALQYATHTQNLDRIASGGGGDSSYNRQLALKTGTDLNLNTLLQNIAQQRSDEEYIRQNQLGLAGRRTALADSVLQRQLVPSQLQKSELGWGVSTIGDLMKLNEMNNMYGVKYAPSIGAQFAQFGKNDWNDVKDIVGMATGVLSAAQGGSGYNPGPAQSTAPVSTTSWGGGGSAPYASGGGWSLPSAGALPGYAPSSYTLPPLGQTYSSMVPSGWGSTNPYAPTNFAAAPSGWGY